MLYAIYSATQGAFQPEKKKTGKRSAGSRTISATSKTNLLRKDKGGRSKRLLGVCTSI
jgi:hypothetical protein